MEKNLQLTESSRKLKALTSRCIYCSLLQRTSPEIISTALHCLSQELAARSTHLQMLKEHHQAGSQCWALHIAVTLSPHQEQLAQNSRAETGKGVEIKTLWKFQKA